MTFALHTMGLTAIYSEGGFFKARLSFPPEFPLLPPKMRFITPMWHPNSTVLVALLFVAPG
jgi:ubiquitin-conjugating enzyme E2 G1